MPCTHKCSAELQITPSVFSGCMHASVQHHMHSCACMQPVVSWTTGSSKVSELALQHKAAHLQDGQGADEEGVVGRYPEAIRIHGGPQTATHLPKTATSSQPQWLAGVETLLELAAFALSMCAQASLLLLQC